ncbi:MAG: peptidoglycan recognition protein family protein [Oscillospiraceae bacterium]|nr:peptidoglycan recognition protein family protein [Oscillospiraceae bacterium]MCL2278576.1 peptidoglycan recognition protein family protein [Oscillospiraceae bacterium]
MFNDDDDDDNVIQEFTEVEPVPAPRVSNWIAATFALISLTVIIGAFVIEAGIQREPYYDEYIPRTPVQAELLELDWIEQIFLDINPFSRPGIYLEEINGIVIHNIGNPDTTALQNRNYFNNLQYRQHRFASSHFIICMDGAIIQCVPVDEIAYASNIRNYDTISIEVTHPDETGRFTTESYAALVRLTAWLMSRYDLNSTDVIRHHDVRGVITDCPRYFVNNPDAWIGFLRDIEIEMERQSQ